MSGWWVVPALLFGVGIGAYIERYRWLTWARREHPDEAKGVTWL
jgi:hypothetical protein